jgi:hypothetical protein
MRGVMAWVVCCVLAAGCSAAESVAGQRGGGDQPATAKWTSGAPVGLYFMTRFWAPTSSLEKTVWYFAPDGTVYENLTDGFSAADLAAHKGRRGKGAMVGDKLEVTHADGKTTSSKFSADKGGFGWNGGIFTAVKPLPAAAVLAGKYEGGQNLASAAGVAITSRSLELRADGTYSSGAVSSVSSSSDRSQVSVGSSRAAPSGTWAAGAYSITLTDGAGKAKRAIAFPYDDASTPLTPDYLYIGGTLFKRR